MHTVFRTNVDCCKKFMSNISGLSIQVNVGDRVRVYHDSAFDHYMKVCEREWTFTNGSDPVLTCYLAPDGLTIPEMERRLRSAGLYCGV